MEIMAWVSALVELSGQAGPEAIMSRGSPIISESIIAIMRALLQAMANLPPFTAESRLRMVFISVISAPEASSCLFTSCNSSSDTSGLSNRALPPPETRNISVSFGVRLWARERAASAPRTELPSGTGCPASYMAISSEKLPAEWPYLVMITPFSMRLPR